MSGEAVVEALCAAAGRGGAGQRRNSCLTDYCSSTSSSISMCSPTPSLPSTTLFACLWVAGVELPRVGGKLAWGVCRKLLGTITEDKREEGLVREKEGWVRSGGTLLSAGSATGRPLRSRPHAVRWAGGW